MVSVIYLNGSFCEASQAKISVFDRGFLFADSVYEVIPVYQGQFFYLEKHLERLNYSLNNAKISKPKIDWKAILTKLVQLNGEEDLQVYLQVTRGCEGIRKHDIPTQLEPTIIAFTIHKKYPSFAEKKRGLQAKLVEDIRWLRCDIKTTALIGSVLLNDEARAEGKDTAILTREGFLTEGGAANVFIVDAEKRICTPPLTHLCLAGITRQLTIDLIKNLSLPFIEKPIPTQAIFSAKEVWITSTTNEIYPITQVDEITIGNGTGGPLWHKLNECYQQLIKQL